MICCHTKMKVKVKSLSHVRFFATPWTVQFARFLHPWDSPGKNTEVGCRFLLQGIFPTQGWNPGSPALEADALTSEPPVIQNLHIYFQIHENYMIDKP